MNENAYLTKLQAQWEQLQAEWKKTTAEAKEEVADAKIEQQMNDLEKEFNDARTMAEDKVNEWGAQAEATMQKLRSDLGLDEDSDEDAMA